MNNVVDEVLNTSATENVVKYIITESDGTQKIVQLDLATPITTLGTALNKVLFDSIKADLNTRLLITSKATASQVIAGTNDTNYVTASALNTLKTQVDHDYTSSQTSVQTYTYNISGTGRTLINGYLLGYSSNAVGDVIAANGATVLTLNYNDGSTISVDACTANQPEGFKIEIDWNLKMAHIVGLRHNYTRNENYSYVLNTVTIDQYIPFNSIESIKIQGKYRSNLRTTGYHFTVYRDL